ncbi:uncharacterized protein LOC122307745 [Carya illinoinensis]|uniref:uncharacterized protein LOC122307745 n=1 Tax=Carya illinoinensis TaxID=32201 RepID=UPI001C71AFA6|nr:uncharacterized protein LOC122307745 [Carya illinoinensis]
MHHHHILFDKYHPGYFGKVGMRYFHKLRNKFYCPIVNVDKLWLPRRRSRRPVGLWFSLLRRSLGNLRFCERFVGSEAGTECMDASFSLSRIIVEALVQNLVKSFWVFLLGLVNLFVFLCYHHIWYPGSIRFDFKISDFDFKMIIVGLNLIWNWDIERNLPRPNPKKVIR